MDKDTSADDVDVEENYSGYGVISVDVDIENEDLNIRKSTVNDEWLPDDMDIRNNERNEVWIPIDEDKEIIDTSDEREEGKVVVEANDKNGDWLLHNMGKEHAEYIDKNNGSTFSNMDINKTQYNDSHHMNKGNSKVSDKNADRVLIDIDIKKNGTTHSRDIKKVSSNGTDNHSEGIFSNINENKTETTDSPDMKKVSSDVTDKYSEGIFSDNDIQNTRNTDSYNACTPSDCSACNLEKSSWQCSNDLNNDEIHPYYDNIDTDCTAGIYACNMGTSRNNIEFGLDAEWCQNEYDINSGDICNPSYEIDIDDDPASECRHVWIPCNLQKEQRQIANSPKSGQTYVSFGEEMKLSNPEDYRIGRTWEPNLSQPRVRINLNTEKSEKTEDGMLSHGAGYNNPNTIKTDIEGTEMLLVEGAEMLHEEAEASGSSENMSAESIEPRVRINFNTEKSEYRMLSHGASYNNSNTTKTDIEGTEVLLSKTSGSAENKSAKNVEDDQKGLAWESFLAHERCNSRQVIFEETEKTIEEYNESLVMETLLTQQRYISRKISFYLNRAEDDLLMNQLPFENTYPSNTDVKASIILHDVSSECLIFPGSKESQSTKPWLFGGLQEISKEKLSQPNWCTSRHAINRLNVLQQRYRSENAHRFRKVSESFRDKGKLQVVGTAMTIKTGPKYNTVLNSDGPFPGQENRDPKAQPVERRNICFGNDFNYHTIWP